MNLKILLHICDTNNFDYLPYTIFCFCLNDFQLNTDFSSQFCIFYCKTTSLYSKNGFSRKCIQKEQKLIAFFSQGYRLKQFFYSNWKQFQVFKIVRCEFNVTVHYDLWAKCTQLWPLNTSKVNMTSLHMYLQKGWKPACS